MTMLGLINLVSANEQLKKIETITTNKAYATANKPRPKVKYYSTSCYWVPFNVMLTTVKVPYFTSKQSCQLKVFLQAEELLS